MYQSLQAGRAAAAALVVLFHLGGTFGQAKYFGWPALAQTFGWGDSGVEFFFVLSGFLITTIHRRDFGHPRALGAYLRKRLLRIYPTYWLICLAVCAAALFFPTLRQALPGDVPTLLKGLALWPQNPAVVGGTGSPILFVAWSLQYEMLFYAIVALAIVSRVAGLLAASLLMLAGLSCRFGPVCTFPQSFVASPLILLFAMGVACAYVVPSRWRVPAPRPVGMAALLGFVAFGAFEMVCGRDTLAVDRRLVYGALASVIVVSLVQAEASGALVLRSRWIVLLGDSSYALYLLHIPVISVLCKLALVAGISGHAALVAAYFAIFAACIGTAIAFHLLIERPLLARFQRGPRRKPATPPIAVDRDLAGPARQQPGSVR